MKSLKAKCLLPSFHSDVALENKQTCDKFNHLEPVQPSSLVPLSHGLKENPTEEAPHSSAPEKLLQQSASTEPMAIPQSISCQSQKHCKDHELIIVSTNHETVLIKKFSLREHFFTWLKNVLLERT